jgi:hypothetical protein
MLAVIRHAPEITPAMGYSSSLHDRPNCSQLGRSRLTPNFKDGANGSKRL